VRARDDSPEDAAARAVVRVLGGDYEINDTGAEPGQYDVRITTPDGRSIALEVTSFGGDNWKRTRARIRKEQEQGHLAGEGLTHQWWIVFPTGISVRDLEPRLSRLLSRLEGEGITWAASHYEGDVATFHEIAAELDGLRVSEVSVWEESP